MELEQGAGRTGGLGKRVEYLPCMPISMDSFIIGQIPRYTEEGAAHCNNLPDGIYQAELGQGGSKFKSEF